MKQALRNSLIAAGIGLMALDMAAIANAADSKPRLAVCIHNYAGVPSDTLKRSEQIARMIFKHAGVETTWTELAPLRADETSQGQDNDSCATSWTRVEVNLIDHSNFGLRSTVLGLAPGSNSDTNRNTVYVFDQVANRIAGEEPAEDVAFILGHAMAHEIGHILTQNEHSRFGIMRANWQKEDFEKMSRGICLTFDSDQAARIRNEVTRRTREQVLTEVTTNTRYASR